MQIIQISEGKEKLNFLELQPNLKQKKETICSFASVN